MKPSELSRRFVARYDRRKLRDLTKEQLLAIGFEAGLKSRAGMGPYVKKSTSPMKIYLRPKHEQAPC